MLCFVRGLASAQLRQRGFALFLLVVKVLLCFWVDEVLVSAFPPLLTPTIRRAQPTFLSSSSTSNNFDSTAVSADLQYLETVRLGLAEAGLEDDWTAAATFLSQDLAMELPQAEDALARAWKWRSWAVVQSKVARRFIKPLPPNLSQLQAAVAWLREGPLAGIPDDILLRGVREHPDVYLVTPELMYQQALSAAPEAYSDAETFRSLLVETPSVLGCTFNCVDTGCNSNCGSCWVTFQTVLKQSKKN